MSGSAAALVANKHFRCTECGKCCTGKGDVWVNEAERVAIAAHLHVQLDQFVSKYCSDSGEVAGWHTLKYKAGPDKVCLSLLRAHRAYFYLPEHKAWMSTNPTCAVLFV